tara:strand:+ start:1846 stop:3630 length:1785 start_codon:yes stop_codon:yes gene_type:complete
MIRVSDYIMDQLWNNGVKHIFMVTGRGALFLTDAVAAHKELKGISVHHEQTAAFASVAYADYNEKLGACLVSTGCAGTNTITGLLNAWQDGIPCVFISGQNKLAETSYFTGIPIRTYGQQEANLIPVVKTITKYSVMITDANDVAYEFEKALYLAQNGRKGPVWIDIPLDVQNKRIDPNGLKHYKPNKKPFLKASKNDIKYVIDSIDKAERPTILIGSGIRAANAINELEALIKMSCIPVTYANSAPDTYSIENPLSIGSVGIMGSTRAGNFAVQNSDLLIVLGCRLTTMTTGEDCQKFAREAKVIVVDIDPIEHSKDGIRIDRLVISDLSIFLLSLIKEKIKKTNLTWQNKCLHWKKTFPRCEEIYKKSKKVDLYQLAESLSDALPDNSIFLSDSGLIELILPTNIGFKKNQRCIHPSSQGSMGFALPALVGAHYASKRPLITVIGDGSIMMNLQELETIRYNDIPAKIFILNNNVYAVIRKRQVDLFRSRTIGVDPSDGISSPNFKKVANAFDLPYAKIKTSNNLKNKLKDIINFDGAVICEIMGKEDQDYITTSYAKNSKRRIVQRPLEDQAPFIDRSIFLSEMIIEPIDQ